MAKWKTITVLILSVTKDNLVIITIKLLQDLLLNFNTSDHIYFSILFFIYHIVKLISEFSSLKIK